MLFALALERDPVSSAHVPYWVISFLQDGGGFAAFGLAIWVLAYLIRRVSSPRGAAAGAPLDPFGGFVRLVPVTPGAAVTVGASRMAFGAAAGLDRSLAEIAPWLRRLFTLAVIATAAVYGLLGLIRLPEVFGHVYAFVTGEGYTAGPPSTLMQTILEVGLTVGGACALFA